MKKPRALPVFSPDEQKAVHAGLAMKVAGMMCRKLEKPDWTEVYCRAKSIPPQGWSNLRMDVMHEGLGAEHKMLCIRAEEDIRAVCGTSRMHPAATRSIRVDARQDADAAMQSVFEQYAALLESHRKLLREKSVARTRIELRNGWLLWRQSLKQFLYFEELMVAPDPRKHRAEWVASGAGRGTRKTSRNLWIYEEDSDRKRFSVTTDAGVKIQPYFDVPAPSDPNLYVFTVIGEYLDTGLVRVWLTEATADALKQRLGGLQAAKISRWLLDFAPRGTEADASPLRYEPGGVPVLIDPLAYESVRSKVEAVNDDHLFRSLLHFTNL